jgi:hypothetical protein
VLDAEVHGPAGYPAAPNVVLLRAGVRIARQNDVQNDILS